jgi:uncharacterized protein YjbI with pentapeptide repeats
LDLIGADFCILDLSNANLCDATLRDAYLFHANLFHADLTGAYLCGAVLNDANLSDANLSDAILSGAELRNANLTGANLTGAHCNRTILNNADLSGADLSGADLCNANLNNTKLCNANITRAKFSGADLSNANLSRSKLSETDFSGANFSRTVLHDADFANASMYTTIFTNTDLSVAKGLDSVRHKGSSEISISTLYKSGGNIPEAFLRGCGVPDTFITFARSLVGTAIDFYSCFISFTEADDAISERLHNDLQAAGVRCWRWKEDAKWGKTLMRSIDEAVRVYDRLVVICSEQSLNSPAVIREIERALQKEDDLARQGKESEVLFPIRIDDYIFTGWNHHRKADVLAKNVGDFRNWHEPTKYKGNLDRLLRDLKSEESHNKH